METLIDQLAHDAGIDPVEYRRGLFKNHSRHLAALNLVAEKGNWNRTLAPGRFKGIAVHEAFGSVVAIIAEVSVEKGVTKVHQVDCAIECGLAVNPDGVKAQMESGIIFSISMAMYGELTFVNGELQQNNFYDYRITRMYEAPRINVYIVDSKEKMGVPENVQFRQQHRL
ncbi:molybdopterin cofactor-binding domain-containing protein [Mucilaginibacter sp. P19]